MVLLTGLPLDKSNFLAPYYEAIINDESSDTDSTSVKQYRNTKQQYDSKANRNSRPRTRMSLDDFLAQSDGLGARTNLNKTNKQE